MVVSFRRYGVIGLKPTLGFIRAIILDPQGGRLYLCHLQGLQTCFVPFPQGVALGLTMKLFQSKRTYVTNYSKTNDNALNGQNSIAWGNAPGGPNTRTESPEGAA
jgi:hypothetical protein